MKPLVLSLLLALAAPAYAPVHAQADPDEAAGPQSMVEIYRIAPGEHEAFLRFIARCDEANRLAGLPPRALYVHSDGADWDFLLIQPAKTPPARQAALDAAWKKLGLPEGANFFLAFRKFVAEHSDTTAVGPTTAADYLKGVSPGR